MKISNIINKRQEILVFLQPVGFLTANGILFQTLFPCLGTPLPSFLIELRFPLEFNMSSTSNELLFFSAPLTVLSLAALFAATGGHVTQPGCYKDLLSVHVLSGQSRTKSRQSSQQPCSPCTSTMQKCDAHGFMAKISTRNENPRNLSLTCIDV